MNTYPVSIQQAHLFQGGDRRQLKSDITVSRRETLALFGAAITATVLAFLFVWVASMATNSLVAAGTWGLGFIFLGLATDSRKWPAIWQLTMGIALLVLALLQVTLSPDFALVSGALVTIWIAARVFMQLR